MYNSLTDTQITGGFWKKMQELNRGVTMRAVYNRFLDTGRIAAMDGSWKIGMPHQPHIFWDSDVAKWMEAAAYLLSGKYDAELSQRVEQIIDAIERSQWTDGYYNSYYTAVEPSGRFLHRLNHELYCAGHLIEAAVAYYEATGRDRFLHLMEKYADLIETVFVKERTAAFVTPGHEEIELALLRLYRCTGKQRYLKLALFFIENRGRQREEIYSNVNAAYDQQDRPARELTEAKGHAVRALYLYTAMADLAYETADESLFLTCRQLFSDIVNHKMYITGGVGSTATGEAFTVAYDLPTETAYAETCASIALLFFSQNMLKTQCNAVYADTIERTLYNGILSGISYDGRAFFYENPLEITLRNHTRHTSTIEKDRLPVTQRKEVFDCSCCPPNLNRLLASLQQLVYSYKNDTYYVHQFMTSTMQHDAAAICQTTDFPDSGRVQLRFTGVKRAAVRIPWWCDMLDLYIDSAKEHMHTVQGFCDKGSILIRLASGRNDSMEHGSESHTESGAYNSGGNGRAAEKKSSTEGSSTDCAADRRIYTVDRNADCIADYGITIKDGYLYLENPTEVKLHFSMQVKRCYANAEVYDCAGKCALLYGPVVYCVESVDNGGCSPHRLFISEKLNAAFEPCDALDTNYLVVDGWRLESGDALYSTQPQHYENVRIKYIPYRLFANRGESDMAVWLKYRE